jgi:hypothetical protein
MWEPIRGLSEFLAVLHRLESGELSPFPFYCALLYTVAGGVDAELARFVDTNWDELDGMTGDNCLVFVLGDARDEAAAGHRPFTVQEVYRVAEELGVKPRALPCAAFFTEPARSREVLRLRIGEYLPDGSAGAAGERLTTAFRGIASALSSCVRDDRRGELDCLRTELGKEHARFAGRPSGREQLEAAASTTEALEKVVVSGATIATTVLRALGGI